MDQSQIEQMIVKQIRKAIVSPYSKACEVHCTYNVNTANCIVVSAANPPVMYVSMHWLRYELGLDMPSNTPYEQSRLQDRLEKGQTNILKALTTMVYQLPMHYVKMDNSNLLYGSGFSTALGMDLKTLVRGKSVNAFLNLVDQSQFKVVVNIQVTDPLTGKSVQKEISGLNEELDPNKELAALTERLALGLTNGDSSLVTYGEKFVFGKDRKGRKTIVNVDLNDDGSIKEREKEEQ